MTVHNMLTRKSSTIYTIEQAAPIASAIESLSDHGIGVLIVTETEGKMVGIISERDIVRAVTAKGKAALEIPVSEFMTREVKSCTRPDKLVDIMQRMSEGRFRHFPVLEDGQLVGVISIGDVVKSRIEELEQEKNALHEYIHSS